MPYGYVKDPENLKHWLVDPEAAAIVKRIFSMCMEAVSYTHLDVYKRQPAYRVSETNFAPSVPSRSKPALQNAEME